VHATRTATKWYSFPGGSLDVDARLGLLIATGPTGEWGANRLIPVSVVTGFLGSGKTTLISRILRDPQFRRTAVIVNEFGEIGLDHELIVGGDESILTLNTGCLCCAVQSDLARTLIDLLERRGVGTACYDRVLIETSGLSDPAPILQAMITDGGISTTHRLAAVVTLVDTVHGEQTLQEFAEARHQVALADRILLSKTDVQSPSRQLMARVKTLNPGVPLATTSQVDRAVLFDGPTIVSSLSERIAGTRRERGHGEIDTVTIVRARPLPALVLPLLLQAIAEHCGSRLLRLKGFVAIEEMPGRPAVIHGVRHVVSPPEFLDRWPDGNEQTRIVLITRGVPRHFVSRLMDAIEDEVRDEIASP
jgi:G3E family GTPase